MACVLPGNLQRIILHMPLSIEQQLQAVLQTALTRISTPVLAQMPAIMK
jgi:hypothetical protein